MRNNLSRHLVLFPFILMINACFFRFPPDYKNDTKLAEKLIAKDEILQRLDKLCQELPKPDDFKFLGKSAGSNVKFVGYNYKTSFRYQQAKKFYDEYFQKNGWTLREERPNWGSWFKYTKNDDFVSIQCQYENVCYVSCSDKY